MSAPPGPYLPQVLVQALVRGPQQGPDAEAVRVLLVSDLRLLQQGVQLLPDVGLDLVVAVTLGRAGRSEGDCTVVTPDI